MEKKSLIDALGVVSDSTAIGAIFTFDRRYTEEYPCCIIGVTMVYADDKWKAVLKLEEIKEDEGHADETDAAYSQQQLHMLKIQLIQVLNVLVDDSEIEVEFMFKDYYSSRYRAVITGVEFTFGDNGTKVNLLVKEVAKDKEAAA